MVTCRASVQLGRSTSSARGWAHDQAPANDVGERSACASAAGRSAASTMTRTSGSVPDGRSSTRPESPSSASTSATAAASSRIVVEARGVDALHVDQDLRQPVHHAGELGQRLPAPPPGDQVQPGEHAVAGGRVVEQDHVAGLLAAEAVAAGLHRLEHVPVADRGLDHLMPSRRIASRSPRLDITVTTSVSWASVPASRIASARTAMIWSPSTTSPVGVDREAPVGVAVVRDPEVGAVLADRGRSSRQGGSSRTVVDVQPSGSAPIAITSAPARRRPRARPARRRRGRSRPRPQAVEPVRQRRAGAHVPLGGVGAGRGRGRPARHRSAAATARRSGGSIASSISSGSLCPPRAKNLMPLSGIGVVRRRQHHAEVGVERVDEVRDAGVGSTPTRSTSTPGAREAGDHRRLEELPETRGSRPTTATGRCAGERAGLAEYVRCRHRQVERPAPA